MTAETKIPFYAKAALIFVGLFAFIGTLYIAQHIIVPIIYSTIIAIVLSPSVDFLVRRKMNRLLAISISLSLLSIIAILFGILLTTEINVLTDSFPKLLDKFHETLNKTVLWASANFNISTQKINAFISEAKTELLIVSKSSIGATLTSMGSAMIALVLIPVYVFMILFYQPLLLDFIRRIFSVSNHKEVNEVLVTTKRIVQKYLVALLVEAVIMAILYSAGLLFIGIDYAIVLGIIGALVNVIPYVGGIVAMALPMMVAFVTKSSTTYTLIVFVVYVIIQFIDNHYVKPKIVASKVQINALVSIVVVLVGSALWGVPGMFLSIPLTAILKVIFDHIEVLKPWGFLLGDTMPAINLFALKKKTLKLKSS
jgi:predicted PurR-regulated permease PerM